MKLSTWMKLVGETDRSFARKLGRVHTVVTRYRSGISRPDWPGLEAIARLTNGAVMPNDFLPELPVEVAPERSVDPSS